MSDVRTDPVAERYGTPSPGRRRAVIVASGLVGLVALVWVAWAAWFQSTPAVQSTLRTFEVIDSHTVTAQLAIKPRSREVTASCLVRASGLDHSVVGELNFQVSGESRTVVRTVTLRTERKATSVELVGCTAPGQPQPR